MSANGVNGVVSNVCQWDERVLVMPTQGVTAASSVLLSAITHEDKRLPPAVLGQEMTSVLRRSIHTEMCESKQPGRRKRPPKNTPERQTCRMMSLKVYNVLFCPLTSTCWATSQYRSARVHKMACPSGRNHHILPKTTTVHPPSFLVTVHPHLSLSPSIPVHPHPPSAPPLPESAHFPCHPSTQTPPPPRNSSRV